MYVHAVMCLSSIPIEARPMLSRSKKKKAQAKRICATVSELRVPRRAKRYQVHVTLYTHTHKRTRLYAPLPLHHRRRYR